MGSIFVLWTRPAMNGKGGGYLQSSRVPPYRIHASSRRGGSQKFHQPWGVQNYSVATLWWPNPGLHFGERRFPQRPFWKLGGSVEKRTAVLKVRGGRNLAETLSGLTGKPSQKICCDLPASRVGCVGRFSPSLGVHGSWLCRCLGSLPSYS